MDPSQAEKVVTLATEVGWLGPDASAWRPRVEELRSSGELPSPALSTLAEAIDVALASGVSGSASDTDPTAPAFRPGTSRADERPAGDPEDERRRLGSTGRYRMGRILGEGGMGRVFEAFDRELERPVALKVLTADASASRRERFLREAKAQAGVDHPHVCRVWEAGEADGRPYLSMQLLEGRTLGDLVRASTEAGESLPLEELVRIVRAVALGLHAAHRQGLVHRDVKPSNVMVVAGADGGWHPFLMDFGIARQVSAPGPTVTGNVVGTPWYMAPEQVASRRVDRRTDVYGLGVTLYELLADRRPFDADTSIEVLMKILEEDPAPLGAIAPHVPADLATIAMKCLERDAARRYASARDLADDLGRFLDGEPIAARRPSLPYRVAKLISRHRGIAAVALAGLIVSAGLGLLAARERRDAFRKARMAQRYGTEAEQMEWTLRAVQQLPPHDTTPSRREIRERLAGLATEVDRDGDLARGPGHLALGRGHFALGNVEQAAHHLERAWEAGERDPEVAFALGQVHLARWAGARDRARAVEDENVRDAALAEAERRHGEPAQRFLELAATSQRVPAAYLRALGHFVEERWEPAAIEAEEAARATPWLYEALTLAGQAAMEAGTEDDLRRARGSLEEATARGSSDPRTWESLCRLEVVELKRAAETAANGIEEHFDAAMAACDRALEVAPEIHDAIVPRTEATVVRARLVAGRGADPRELLDAAEPLARRATEREPDRAAGHFALGLILSQRAMYLRNLGEDAFPTFEAALDSLSRAREATPWDLAILLELGSVSTELAWLRFEVGEDANPDFQRAITVASAAVDRAPSAPETHYSLGRARSDKASALVMQGTEPHDLLASAAESFENAIEVAPEYVAAYNSLAVVRLRQADAVLNEGGDQRPHLRAGLEALDRALEIRPDYANAHLNRGVLQRALGDAESREGNDPWPWLEKSARSFSRGMEINPNIFFAQIEAGHAYLIGGQWEISRGRDPREALAEARRRIDESLAKVSDDFMGLKMRGHAWLEEARWAWAATGRGEDVEPLLEKALGDFRAGLVTNPNYLQLWILTIEAHVLALESGLVAPDAVAERLGKCQAALARIRELDPEFEQDRRLEGLMLFAAFRAVEPSSAEGRRWSEEARRLLLEARASGFVDDPAVDEALADLDQGRGASGGP